MSFIVALYSKNLGHNEIYVTIGQNCLPIIMLALSILVSGAKYGARAERIHECAQALNHFKKLLKFEIEDYNFSPSAYSFTKYATQYSEILSKYENHSKIDSYIEHMRSAEHTAFWKEPLAGLLGKGVLYYFYFLVSVISVGWMFLGIYLAIKGAIPC